MVPGFLYKDWYIHGAKDGKAAVALCRDDDGDGRWIAVKKMEFSGVEKWGAVVCEADISQLRKLTEWDYEIVDLELVETKLPVKSNAPGGVDES